MDKDMMDSLFFWGVAKRFKYGVGIAATNWNTVSEKKKNTIEKATSNLAKRIKRNSKNVRPGLKTKFFEEMRYENVEYEVVRGRMSCNIAIIEVKKEV